MPLFSVVLVPSMHDERATGFPHPDRPRITAATLLLPLGVIESNETSCGPSEMPRITPVSCTGKNPLGVMTI